MFHVKQFLHRKSRLNFLGFLARIGTKTASGVRRNGGFSRRFLAPMVDPVI